MKENRPNTFLARVDRQDPVLLQSFGNDPIRVHKAALHQSMWESNRAEEMESRDTRPVQHRPSNRQGLFNR
ncbi:MAG: hypothetical protein A3B53_02850 [Candidatus Levybacteria bacterium RIFCSPLOWO2_01_FULL_42_15]|nr:MAG: hypothetical protein A3B53_02850 [Candidatus Levybacteria bacterium RIFCSPLOWO2_01_FULL_42_15]